MTSDLTPPSPSEPAFFADAAPAADTRHDARPRIRWAGIVWGAFFAAIGVVMLGTLADATRRDGIHDWLLTLSPANPGAVVGVSLLAVGVLMLVGGATALLRRAQVRATGDADRMDACARF